MSRIPVTEEHGIHFSLFKYSFELSGSFDILILPAWYRIQLDLSSAKRCMFLTFLSGKSALFSVLH